MAVRFRLGPAEGRFTGRAEGDLGWDADGADGDDAEARRRRVVDRPWTRLRQVHGADVVTVTRPGEHAGVAADAAVTTVPNAVLAVLTADCAPVALASEDGVVGVAHAGWRGLRAGVLERVVERMRALGARSVEARLGPCIHAECYEFGAGDLDDLAARLGDQVRSQTAAGAPALDLPAAVGAALAAVDVPLDVSASACTACEVEWYSHRARRERARHALALWLPPA